MLGEMWVIRAVCNTDHCDISVTIVQIKNIYVTFIQYHISINNTYCVLHQTG